jgi:hypothetical protein
MQHNHWIWSVKCPEILWVRVGGKPKVKWFVGIQNNRWNNNIEMELKK